MKLLTITPTASLQSLLIIVDNTIYTHHTVTDSLYRVEAADWNYYCVKMGIEINDQVAVIRVLNTDTSGGYLKYVYSDNNEVLMLVARHAPADVRKTLFDGNHCDGVYIELAKHGDELCDKLVFNPSPSVRLAAFYATDSPAYATRMLEDTDPNCVAAAERVLEVHKLLSKEI